MADSTKIHRLMLAVVQEKDLEMAINALQELDVPALQMVSYGGFLGSRNATLMIGLPDDMQEVIVSALKRTCHQRVEYLAMPLEGSIFPMPSAVPINVGGATVFTFPVDRFEEF